MRIKQRPLGMSGIVAMVVNDFLTELMPMERFLGSTVEQVLANQATLIYQDVPDQAYFGAALTTTTETLIAINTHQPLRQRYHSVAHELWTVWYGQTDPRLLPEDFNHREAADQFAAAVMMPAGLMVSTWHRFPSELSILARIMQLADLAMVPYMDVVLRLMALDIQLPAALLDLKRPDWLVLRQALCLTPSPFDQAIRSMQFAPLTTLVLSQVRTQQLTLARGATVLTPVDPQTAANLWRRHREIS